MKRKQMSFGAWLTSVAAVITLASIIVYIINISSEGYFQNATVTNLVFLNVVSLLAYAGAVVIGLLGLKGLFGWISNIVVGVLQIGAPVLLSYTFINLISSRVQGLAFIFFSNPDVIKEVQTPANMASAKGTITNMVFLGVAIVVGIVAAFFNTKKEA